MTESDHAEPSKVPLPEFEDEGEYEGLIKANGEINWDCPCLGGMASGVCGEQFKSAFSCFHTSQSEPKGSECIDQFRTMQECFNQYPEIYGEFESVDEDNKNDKELFNEVDDEKTDKRTEEKMSGEVKLSSEDGREAEEGTGSNDTTLPSS